MDVSDYLVNDRHDDVSTLYKLATANKSGRFVTEEDCDKYATSPMYDAVSTGISGLDAIMGGGVGVAELTVLFGYTGTGKSALAQQIAVNAAKSGVKVMYIAGEMTPKQNLDRFVRQWYGGIIKHDELADHYKQVASAILITKFGDLTLSNVTDTIHEGILDYGVRLVIVDVLSDVVGFINADVTQPSKIIKELHKAVKGTEDDIAPCALLCVAHTKGTDNNEPELDDIRGGSVIKQEAECAIAIVEEKRGDLRNTNRVLKLRKKPRNRDFEPDDVIITYDTHSKRYTTPETSHATKDSTDLRLTPRRSLSPSAPSPSVPSEGDIPVGDSTQAETLRVPDELSEPRAATTVSTVSESVQPGLLLPTDEHVHRDEGYTQAGGPPEVTTSTPVTHDTTVQVSSTTDEGDAHTGTDSTTGQPQPSTEDGRFNALRTMYSKHPEILERHRRIQATNHLVRTQLTTLGLLV
jgi:KaiC/GvpD/RAD55 family RecA-like ATPase